MARTITQPANNSAIDSSVVRNQLQLLEDEIASSSSIDPGHLHTPAGVSATGTPDATTFWRGDNVWATPSTNSGTVTTISVVSANGFAGSVANATSTPAITLQTTITGLLKGNGTAISAAIANTDYQSPISLTTTGTSGAATFNGTTLNIPQYTSGGTVDTVVGTTDRITVDATDPANPIVDIAATYVGQTSITTLGTIATGTWSATNIALAKGGTGASLSDPGADAVYVWDNTTNATRLALLSGLIYDTATNTLSSTGGFNLTVGDGGTPVANVDTIIFSGATVTDDTGGQVTVTITGGSGGTLDDAYDFGGAGAGRSITADAGAVSITVPDTSNNTGLIIVQNDATNDPLALEVNGKHAGGVAKVTPFTLVQYNDTDGNNSDWSFNVAGSGGIQLNLQVTGGTLDAPAVTANGDVGAINWYVYNSTPAQKEIAYVNGVLDNNTASAEYGHLELGVRQNGTSSIMLSVGYETGQGTTINGIALGDANNPAIITSQGFQDLNLQTGNTTTGSINITNGADGTIQIAPNGAGVAQIYNTSAGATGAILELYQDSASPAANDPVGTINFYGKDSANNKQKYGGIRAEILDATSTSEDSALEFYVTIAGTDIQQLQLSGTYLGPASSSVVDLGRATAQFSNLYLSSTKTINFGNGNWIATHSSGILTVGTGDLRVTTAGTNTASVVTVGGTQTLIGKSIGASQITTGTFGTGAYTMDTSLAVPQVFNADHAIAASSNAATVTRAFRNNVVTNSSAATLTVTMSTTSAAGGDMLLVQILDFSAAAQTITWVNTENSTVTAPVTSNGSTTLPITVGFKWNTSTSKWRCIASA